MKDIPEVQRGTIAAVLPASCYRKAGERGGARLKLLVTLLVLALAGYTASQYVPIAIHAYQYKDFMQQTVDRATFGQTQSGSEWVKAQLKANATEYAVPPEAIITATQRDGRIEARVQFTRLIPLPGYVYEYTFDHTARSTQLYSAQ